MTSVFPKAYFVLTAVAIVLVVSSYYSKNIAEYSAGILAFFVYGPYMLSRGLGLGRGILAAATSPIIMIILISPLSFAAGIGFARRGRNSKALFAYITAIVLLIVSLGIALFISRIRHGVEFL